MSSCIALMAIALGCSSSSEPPGEAVSEAELSGRYDPGTADAKWIWFSGGAGSPTFKGEKKDGSAFQGAYRFEKSPVAMNDEMDRNRCSVVKAQLCWTWIV